MDLGDFTGAEIQQMWAEKCRADWQHTASIVGHLIAVNATKKRDIPSLESLNPMESEHGQNSKTGVPLNSPDARLMMKAIADGWQKH